MALLGTTFSAWDRASMARSGTMLSMSVHCAGSRAVIEMLRDMFGEAVYNIA